MRREAEEKEEVEEEQEEEEEEVTEQRIYVLIVSTTFRLKYFSLKEMSERDQKPTLLFILSIHRYCQIFNETLKFSRQIFGNYPNTEFP